MRIVIVAVVLLASCSPTPVTPPHGVDACDGACVILRKLECPEGNPTCEADCERVASLGYVWPDDTAGPACVVAGPQTVETVRMCEIRCEQ